MRNFTEKGSYKKTKSGKKACLKIYLKKLKYRGTGIRMNPPVFMVLSTAKP
jgi:hypothetical protein